jgi:nucleoside-diphosphate-sugar epimerase
MVRRESTSLGIPGTVHVGDVRDVTSIRDAVRGTDAVVHCASYVGYDPEVCQETNVAGTQNVVEACAAEGIDRLVYMSTASVYGSGPHCGAREDELEVRPESALSRSRADAETVVLDAGGLVLRPDMVFGPGDKWFGPGLIRFTRSVGGLVENGAALMSVVHVDDLGFVAARLATADSFTHGALNVSYDQPASVSEIVNFLQIAPDGLASPPSITRPAAQALAAAAGFTTRQFALLTTDHWFSAGKLRAALDLDDWSGPRVKDDDIAWYRARCDPIGESPAG